MTCSTIVIHCIDSRIQAIVDDWIAANCRPGDYDRVSHAGGVKDIIDDVEAIWKNIRIAVVSHGVSRVVLFNHTDCLAYGQDNHIDHHAKQLQTAAAMIRERYVDVSVEPYICVIGNDDQVSLEAVRPLSMAI